MKNKKYFIANWKMELSYKQSVDLSLKMKELAFAKNFKLILSPSFPMIPAVLRYSDIEVSAQDCAAWEKGAYTGEVSAKVLKEIGCSYAIVGHSERRNHLNESDELINEKIKQTFGAGLIPILCFGEKEDELEKKEQVIVSQLKNALKNLSVKNNDKIFFAYEPVWAIGSGRNCPADRVIEVFRTVKRAAVNVLGAEFFDNNTEFIYGGSVDSENINEYFDKKEINGFLVGSSSLKMKEMKKMFD